MDVLFGCKELADEGHEPIPKRLIGINELVGGRSADINA